MASEVVLNGNKSHNEPIVPTYAEAFPPLQSAGGSTVSEAPVKSLRVSNVTQVRVSAVRLFQHLVCVCVCVCVCVHACMHLVRTWEQVPALLPITGNNCASNLP